MLQKRLLITVLLAVFAATPAWSQQDSNGATSNQQSTGKAEAELSQLGKQQALRGYGRLPLSFEVNQGQTDGQVKFVSRRPGYSFFLTPTQAVLALSKPLEEADPEILPGRHPVKPRKFLTSALHIKLVGANPTPSVNGLEELETKSNYFIGNNPKEWQTNVPNYAKVKYLSVYPGVDLVYYGSERELENDFIIYPGGDPRAITLGFDKSEKLRIDEHGDLVVKGKIGEVHFEKPVVYQEVAGIRQQVAGEYIRKGKNQIGFRVGKYDVTKTLVIDPVLSYSTYLNSNYTVNEYATAIAVDSAGSAYVTGQTSGLTFPTTSGALQTSDISGQLSAFVMKLNPTGSGLIYSTYLSTLGGPFGDAGTGIAVDSSGSAYVTGYAYSNFPTTAGAFRQVSPAPATNQAAFFVTKLNATGSALIYSTYLGAGIFGGDQSSIAVDSAGCAYVTGSTVDNHFPTTAGAFQILRSTGNSDAFVTKLSADGSALIYSTFLGSYPNTVGTGIAVDSNGSAYVTGITESNSFFVTPGAFQTGESAPPFNNFGFVTKFTADGSGLIYSTYLGGAGTNPTGVALDSAGSVYVTGFTQATNFPTTAGAFQTTFSGTSIPGSASSSWNPFVTKLNAGLSALIYSTFLGSTTFSGALAHLSGIAVDSAGSASVTGQTNSTSFPTTADAFQSNLVGNTSAFVTKLTADGSGLVYSTYLGASGSYTSGLGIAVDSTGSIYVAGPTNLNFPVTPGAFQTTVNSVGNGSGFVAKFAFDQPNVLLVPTSLAFPGTMVGQSSTAQTVTFSASGSGALAFSKIALAGTNAGDYAVSSNTCGATLAAGASCQVQVTFAPEGAGARSATLQFTDDVSGSPQSVSLSGTGLSAAPTTTTLTSSSNQASLGQSVTFTAMVTSTTAGTPTGTVTFFDGATPLPSIALSGAQASFGTSSLSVGTHSITATYSGDANFLTSTSAAVSLSVLPPQVVAITDNEKITVTDSSSFPDLYQPEVVKVQDAVTVTPLISVAAPVIFFSSGSLGFSSVAAGLSGTQTLTLSDIGEAALTVASATLPQGSAFAVLQIACSNGATSLPTTLPIGGACILTISYLAPSAAAANDALTVTDNAALSNLATVPAGTSYAQVISLNGSGTSVPPPPAPPAIIPVVDNESVTVTDSSSFPDVFDPEAIKVTDQVTINAYFATTTAVTSLTVPYGTSGSATVSVASPGSTVNGNATLSVDGGTPSTMALTGGTATFNLGVLSIGTHTLSASFATQGTFGGSSGAGTFTVTASSKLALVSISPNAGARGTTIPVILNGSALTGAATVNVSGSGITVGPLMVVSDTQVNTSLTITAAAALTARNVTVTTATGTSNAVTFTVVAPPVPTLTSISPTSELRGTSVPLTLTGTNFVTGATVVATPPAAGVSISGVTVLSATTINATLTSITSAAIGSVNIEVVTAGGASNTQPFSITGPVLTSIAPASANRGTTGLMITLTGSGLTGATSVNVPGGGITVSSLTVLNDTTVTATLNVAAGAAAGARNVTVTASGGNSNAVTFTVTVPPSGLFSITPNTGARGTTQPVVLTGISLTTATAINVTGGGITVSGLTVVSDTQVNAAFTIAAGAASTARNVTITTSAAGTTTPVTFTVVNPGTPILSSITPALGLRRTFAAANPVAVVLTGSNFTAGSTVNVMAPANGVSVTGVTVVSPTQINASFSTTSTAAIGPRNITVTNPGGTSDPMTYTVLGPALTSISPTSAVRGGAVLVSLFGSGLTGTTAVNVPAASGITVGPITVVSDTQVSTTFTIAAAAPSAATNVSVTAPGGVSNTAAFTVTIPPTPTLTSISLNTGVRGSTLLPVTLTGSNFIPGQTTVAISGGGITVSGVTVASSTQITATFTISNTAALTTRNVTAVVAGATVASNPELFTVQGPTITSISPNSATHPVTGTLAVPVTINGANLTGATGLTGLGSGVSAAAGSFTVINSTTITVTLNVLSTATTGIRNIGVTTPIGTTNTLPFTVN